MIVRIVYKLDNDKVDLKQGDFCNFFLDCSVHLTEAQSLLFSCKDFSDKLSDFISSYLKEHSNDC